MKKNFKNKYKNQTLLINDKDKKIKKTITHFYRNKKLKKGIFLKPIFKKVNYPFSLNFKLINEFLKKK